MKKMKMKKAEELYQTYCDQNYRAYQKWDFESSRSMGPTISRERVFSSMHDAWQDFVAEIKRKAQAGNPHAKKIVAAIANTNTPGHENDFSDAWDEYLNAET